MNFFQTFYHSLFDIDWLRAKRDTKLSPALFFLLAVVTLVTVFRIGPFFAFLAPRFVGVVEQKIQADVPDFMLTMENGTLKTEKLPQPYTFAHKAEDGNFTLVIDTLSTTTPSIESLIADKDKDFAIVLGKNSFSFFDPDTQTFENEPYTELPNGTLTKEQILTWVQVFHNKYMIPVFIGLMILVILIAFVLRLLFLALWGLMFLGLAKVKKLNWSYKEIYRVGAYASTLPLLISSIMVWFGITIPFATLAFLFIMYLVVVNPYQMHNQPTA